MLQNVFLCCMYNVYLYFTFSIINKPFQNTDIWEMHEIRGKRVGIPAAYIAFDLHTRFSIKTLVDMESKKFRQCLYV